jgi:hypothetical protein
MRKAFTLRKDFNRFTASNRFNLVALQAFTFGIHNARLKLKKDKVRYNDILTVMVVGELQTQGCKVSDFGQILGYNITTSRNALKRAVSRYLVSYYGGKPGRGKVAKFSLTEKGLRVQRVLQNELAKSLKEARNLYFEFVRKRIAM